MKMSWGVFSYELILALVFFLSMLIIRNRNMYSTDNIYSAMVWLYPVLAVTQFVILGIRCGRPPPYRGRRSARPLIS
jgi:hypothetical protein